MQNLRDTWWIITEKELYKEFFFEDFSQAIAFMTQVGYMAERLDHHPEWTNIDYGVLVRLTTHDAGDTVTQKDIELAKEMDKIYR